MCFLLKGPPSSPPSSYGPPPKQIEVTKNIYVHLPPDEQEDDAPPQVIDAPPPKKHYKLIFIKAPEPPKQKAPIIQPQNQDEHKTLVYVLVKKPDAAPQVVVPQPEPTEPSKPEVFFIKYKKNEERPIYGPPNNEYGPPKDEYGAPPPPSSAPSVFQQ